MNNLNFLRSTNYQIYNRELARKLKSVHASIILSDLIDRYNYHELNNELLFVKGKYWFYYTMEKAEERTVLSRKEQDSAIKILIKHNLITKTLKGLPAKRYFNLNDEKILGLFNLKIKSTNLTDTDKLDCPKRTNWNDRNGQTPIYKEPYKEPQLNTIVKSKNKDKIKEMFTETENPVAVNSDADQKKKPKPPIVQFNQEQRCFTGISQRDKEEWRKLYPKIDIDREISKAVQWCLNHPAKIANRKLWRKFLTSWFTNEDNNSNFKKYKTPTKGKKWTSSNKTKKDSSEKGTEEHQSQKWRCLGDVLPKSKTGMLKT